MLIYWYWGHADVDAANEDQVLGLWWEDSNQVFRLVNCIQNVRHGTVADASLEKDGGSSVVECVQFALYPVICLAMLSMFAFLLVLQLKKYAATHYESRATPFKKVKTWCFLFAMTLLALFLLDQIFTPFSINWIVYTLLWASIATFRQLTALTLFHFFSKRARKLIVREQQAKLLAQERFIVGLSIVCFSVLVVSLGFQIAIAHRFEKGTKEKKAAQYLCHSPALVFTDLSCIILTTAMAFLTRRIKKISQVFDEQMLQTLHSSGHSADSSVVLSTQ